MVQALESAVQVLQILAAAAVVLVQQDQTVLQVLEQQEAMERQTL